MALKIEGTIEHEGKTYEAIDYRKADSDEHWLFGKAACKGKTTFETIILREVKPPHEYKVGDWVKVTKDKPDDAELNLGDVCRVLKPADADGFLFVQSKCNLNWYLHVDNAEPCDPPAPKYRPFASAEEFKPHRDRWWSNKSNIAVIHPPGSYSNSRWHGATWQEAFDERVFDDGTPCGVLITE